MKKQIILYVGEICNNDCVMCSLKDDGRNIVSYSNLSEKIKKRRNDADKISFTGGEPTEHPDIIKLFKEANKFGYEIGISTNGKKFSDPEFTKKLVSLGLKEASVTIHGPQKTHNRITGKKSYTKTISGLENLIAEGVTVTTDSVLIKINIDYLQKMWKTVLKMKVKKIGLQDLVPEGGGDANFKELVISYERKKKFFYDNLNFLKKFHFVHVANFPRCVLPLSLPENFIHTSHHQKEHGWQFDGLSNTGTQKLKKKIKVCKKCPYQNKCYGFRKKNLKKFNKESVKEMMEIDNFMEKSNSR